MPNKRGVIFYINGLCYKFGWVKICRVSHKKLLRLTSENVNLRKKIRIIPFKNTERTSRSLSISIKPVYYNPNENDPPCTGYSIVTIRLIPRQR